MNQLPKVSVIIPCFNLGQYLDEAVESVLSQTYQDFEILIVDDGSTDPETQQILTSYRRPKTTVFRTANQKLAGARNFLIDRAQGEYLCALDADDKLHPRFLDETVARIEQEPSLTFVSTHLQMFGEEDRIWPSEARCDLPMLLYDDTIITPALVRRAAVVAVGGYDRQMPHQGDEDWDLWIRLVEAGHRGVILPDVLFFYRRRPGSMCVECTTGQVHLDLIEYLVRKHRDSYRTHLLEVLLRKEACISELCQANAQLETELAGNVVPLVRRRQAELEALKNKLERARQLSEAAEGAKRTSLLEEQLGAHRAGLDAATNSYNRALAETAALRASASWKITAPLRALYERLLRSRSGVRS